MMKRTAAAVMTILTLTALISCGESPAPAQVSPAQAAGLLLYGGAVLFYIITLPVEFNASRRALKILKSAGVFVDNSEVRGARKVLTAAALTYVASALTAIGSFIRLLLLSQRRNNRR